VGLPSAMDIEGLIKISMKVRRVAVRAGKRRLKLDFIYTPKNGLTVLGYTKIVPNQIFSYYSVISDVYKNKS
jgi:hypothetical protein